jgi:hypothetical protein
LEQQVLVVNKGHLEHKDALERQDSQDHLEHLDNQDLKDHLVSLVL